MHVAVNCEYAFSSIVCMRTHNGGTTASGRSSQPQLRSLSCTVNVTAARAILVAQQRASGGRNDVCFSTVPRLSRTTNQVIDGGDLTPRRAGLPQDHLAASVVTVLTAVDLFPPNHLTTRCSKHQGISSHHHGFAGSFYSQVCRHRVSRPADGESILLSIRHPHHRVAQAVRHPPHLGCCAVTALC